MSTRTTMEEKIDNILCHINPRTFMQGKLNVLSVDAQRIDFTSILDLIKEDGVVDLELVARIIEAHEQIQSESVIKRYTMDDLNDLTGARSYDDIITFDGFYLRELSFDYDTNEAIVKIGNHFNELEWESKDFRHQEKGDGDCHDTCDRHNPAFKVSFTFSVDVSTGNRMEAMNMGKCILSDYLYGGREFPLARDFVISVERQEHY